MGVLHLDIVDYELLIDKARGFCLHGVLQSSLDRLSHNLGHRLVLQVRGASEFLVERLAYIGG